jgi:alkyl sulfatase BDS1-like metallo-beta-lactamase superfamily hydrolase
MSRIGDDLVSRSRNGAIELVSEGVAQCHGFSNVGIVWGRGQALLVDTSNARMGPLVAQALHETTTEPVALIVYTHGHIDHVGGAPALLEAAQRQGHPRPTVWAHENTAGRLDRYRASWGWNNEVNRRQFGLPQGVDAVPKDFVYPDRTYRNQVQIDLAGEAVELNHEKAETDDATWVWLPERGVALVGDLSVQSLPNTGNPNKAQRHTLGWAYALEAIAARRPRLVIPGHGDPLRGDYALEVCQETARALRYLHDAVLERLNAGQWPDEIVDARIDLPEDLARKPYLRPIYGCAPFVVRDVLRSYAGWWGGNPAELIPARRTDVAGDLVDAAGREALLTKTQSLRKAGEYRRALHLATLLTQADPSNSESRELVAAICDELAEQEPSFIARNFYRVAGAQARAAVH